MSVPVPNKPLPQSSNLSTSFEAVLQKLDEEFAKISSKPLDKYFFSFDGLDFEVRRVEQGGKYCFWINATIGYVPFSIESDERREAIKTIIIESHTLPSVRFGVDISNRISARALFDVPQLSLPDVIFYPLTLFLQEAWPFINLIGKYLFEPSPAPKPKQDETPVLPGN